jgi:Ca-activated chloride channel family protein
MTSPGPSSRSLPGCGLYVISLMTLLVSSVGTAGGHSPAATQKAVAPASDPEQSEVRTVYVSAVGKDGKVLADLKRGDFQVFENDQEREVVDASPAPPLRFVIALTVDTSRSEHYDQARIGKLNVLYRFLTQTLSTTDKGLISTFNSDFFFETRLTADAAELRKGILKVADTPRRGATAVYDSIVGSIEALSKEQDSFKFVLVLSDFEDNVSRNSLEKTIRAAQQAGAPVFPLMESSSTDRAKHAHVLEAARKVARESGGVVFDADPPEDLGKSLAMLQLATHGAYIVKYRTGAGPPNSKKKEKPPTLQVALHGKKTLFVVVEGPAAP